MIPHDLEGSTRRPSGGDEGQAALLLVIGIAILIATYGSIMVATTIGNDPLIQADNVQHYAYRAVEAGINTFESVINNNPNLAHCDSSLNASPLCTGLHYQVWNSVPGPPGPTG